MLSTMQYTGDAFQRVVYMGAQDLPELVRKAIDSGKIRVPY